MPKIEDLLPLYVDVLGFGVPNSDGDGSVRPTCGVSQIHFSREIEGKKGKQGVKGGKEKGGKGMTITRGHTSLMTNSKDKDNPNNQK